MPYKDKLIRRATIARAVRRNRLFKAAIAAGMPKALEAQEAKDCMRPFNILRAEKDKLSPAERERLKLSEHAGERLSRDSLQRVYARCKALEGRYGPLRDEAIAEFELAQAMS